MIAITICLTSSVTMFSQDIIILKNGDDIQAVVQEVGIDDVKYKRFDNQNGPNYTLRKSDIFMIRYENGTKDVFSENLSGEQQQTTNQPISSYNTNSQEQAPLNYTFGTKIRPYGAEKSPFLAGFLSFLIPGAGQFYNGDVGAGFLYMGCNILCNSIWMNAVKLEYNDYSGYETLNIEGIEFAIGFLGALIVNIGSIVNASQVAKKVNVARGYRLGDNTYLKIQPTMIQNNLPISKEYAYGMSFCLNF